MRPVAKLRPKYTVEQYLALEREAEERSQFIDGDIYAMAGESNAHGLISMNLTVLIGSQLKGTDCQGRTKDTKVRSGTIAEDLTKGIFSYPDLVVICGEVEFHDEKKDVVTNPKVIFEVLSDSTEYFDRGVKFTRYRHSNPTLTEYILISQTEPFVEHYLRTETGDWLLREYDGMDTTFRIDSLDCYVSLGDLYERIVFE